MDKVNHLPKMNQFSLATKNASHNNSTYNYETQGKTYRPKFLCIIQLKKERHYYSIMVNKNQTMEA